ncbi:prenyltransferase/squalene oxidase repeat-containing protein [Qaidamihabitans albus]|uniref:prenyltransferase/squalene oxidase repeat-containing protein n=1 Tax=Qaidamihabitans albus TaxID=2795733 RepID=UPI0018F26BED|nr:prenyltransferase/squalene oxidase repeat-containing protein [Qaidamihabitans albus]
MDSRDSWPEQARGTATRLLAEMAADPAGQFAPSVYETGRLVKLVPALPGHAPRVRFLLEQQHADGAWGGPGDYALVPTLSATEALLALLPENGTGAAGGIVADAAARGLTALSGRIRAHGTLPDTVAVEIIVPVLIDEINAQLNRLNRLNRKTLPALTGWRGAGARLGIPAGANPELATRLREAAAQGHALPHKLWHSLEVLGDNARGAPFVEPVAGGGVGCSPAATAAWLGDRADDPARQPSLRYLAAVQSTSGGVPVAAPLALFERAWVLSTLAATGVPFTAPRTLVDSLHGAFGDAGAAGGLGLPPDADDTATALYALALLGSPRSPECLWDYHSGDHFSCFPEERTPSTSTNAHVLQALGASVASLSARQAPQAQQAQSAPPVEPRHCARYLATIGTVSRWLSEQQHADGSWLDKWHASPYYATACCATALAAYGGAAGARAVGRAVEWVLGTQRPDGSWGHWHSTREETAYAIRTLLHAGPARNPAAIGRAAARGRDFLLRTDSGTGGTGATGEEFPALWHDKDLYTPVRIVRTEVFAALHLAHTDPRVAALAGDGSTGYAARIEV